ncbi:hypothetical protein B0H17DRAFT_1142813 [Mycena rosella]|uniref:Uncharacterized protein n=1 Tax=Mycena rosella TaxID=1033263 RepID=A0AAD7CWL6_MYCRO|nr:hypothetical protein B0H17DRAFT_1142813 [Mycena rosella]
MHRFISPRKLSSLLKVIYIALPNLMRGIGVLVKPAAHRAGFKLEPPDVVPPSPDGTPTAAAKSRTIPARSRQYLVGRVDILDVGLDGLIAKLRIQRRAGIGNYSLTRIDRVGFSPEKRRWNLILDGGTVHIFGSLGINANGAVVDEHGPIPCLMK